MVMQNPSTENKAAENKSLLNSSKASWTFGTILIIFLLYTFLFHDAEVSPVKEKTLGVIVAICAGLFGFFLTGATRLRVEQISQDWPKLALRASGGAGIFFAVLLIWFSNLQKEDPSCSIVISVMYKGLPYSNARVWTIPHGKVSNEGNYWNVDLARKSIETGTVIVHAESTDGKLHASSNIKISSQTKYQRELQLPVVSTMVKGNVFEASKLGKPISAASIVLVGTGIQSHTDATGFFMLSTDLEEGNLATIHISKDGYKTAEFPTRIGSTDLKFEIQKQ